MAAHYDQDQKEPFFNNEESPDYLQVKGVYAKQLTRNCKPTAAPHVSINLILGLAFHGNTEQIGNTDK